MELSTRFPLLVRLGIATACTLLAGPALSQTCLEPPSGLVAWWPGDGDSVDLESGLHAVALNGAAYGPGLVDDAFVLDGVGGDRNDRIDLPPAAIDGLGDVTIEMWVQSTDAQGAYFSGARAPAAGNEMLLYHSLDGTQIILHEQVVDFPAVFLADGAWHHLAFTRTGGMGHLYVDGLLVDAEPVASGVFDIGPGGLMIGQEQDCLGNCLDPNQALDGRVDEVSVYARALSDGEILAIFEAREAGKCKPPSSADLLLEIDELETEVETLLDRIDELEATPQAEEPPHPCQRSHDQRGCWRNRRR